MKLMKHKDDKELAAAVNMALVELWQARVDLISIQRHWDSAAVEANQLGRPVWLVASPFHFVSAPRVPIDFAALSRLTARDDASVIEVLKCINLHDYLISALKEHSNAAAELRDIFWKSGVTQAPTVQQATGMAGPQLMSKLESLGDVLRDVSTRVTRFHRTGLRLRQVAIRELGSRSKWLIPAEHFQVGESKRKNAAGVVGSNALTRRISLMFARVARRFRKAL